MAINQKKVFVVLLVIVVILGFLNLGKATGVLIKEQPSVMVVENTIELNSLTLEQKIAQMVIVHGGIHNLQAWKKMQLGGIHLFAMLSPDSYKNTISTFQKDMAIPFFVTADLEGCQNPFAEFYDSTPNSEITSVEEAFEKGSVDGKRLHDLGFTVNFAPVVDLDDQIWKCRSFSNDVAGFARSYIEGLQGEGIIATAKHYPGKTLVVKDPHKFIVGATISYDDVAPYTLLSDVVDSVMVSHLITTGHIDSGDIPSVVSPEVVGGLKEEFSGLIISDEINMLGLKNFYSTLDEMYIGVFLAGNDLVLNFGEDATEIERMIQVVKAAVLEGKISSEQIDASVTKILQAKGFVVS